MYSIQLCASFYFILIFIIWSLIQRICHFSDNIALRKIAWQLYPYEALELRDSLNASNAVDGLKSNLSFSGKQCTQSANYQYEAQWRVDLGSVLGIHHITIYYRTDNVLWGKYHKCSVIFSHTHTHTYL